MDKKAFVKAEMEGRLRLIYALQMEEPDSTVVSMPLSCHHDLQWEHTSGKIDYIELKDRNVPVWLYGDAMFNCEKMEYNKHFGSDFYFVSTYTDGNAVWFKPYEMAKSGITTGEKWITTTTVDPTSPKVKQKRLFLNFSDLDKVTKVPYINITEDEDE